MMVAQPRPWETGNAQLNQAEAERRFRRQVEA
jgi:hypothetical protein